MKLHCYQQKVQKNDQSVKRVNTRVTRQCIAHCVNYCFLKKTVSIATITTLSYVMGKSLYKRQLCQSFFNRNEFSPTATKSLLANNVYR